jgi:hypothetical protein
VINAVLAYLSCPLRFAGLFSLYGSQGADALARDIGAIGLQNIGPGRFPMWTPKLPASSSLLANGGTTRSGVGAKGPTMAPRSTPPGQAPISASELMSQLSVLPNIARAQIAAATGCAVMPADGEVSASVGTGSAAYGTEAASGAHFKAQSLLYVAGASLSPRKTEGQSMDTRSSEAGIVCRSIVDPGEQLRTASEKQQAHPVPRFMLGKPPLPPQHLASSTPSAVQAYLPSAARSGETAPRSDRRRLSSSTPPLSRSLKSQLPPPTAVAEKKRSADKSAELRQQQHQRRLAASVASHASVESAHAIEAQLLQRASEQLRVAASGDGSSTNVVESELFVLGSLRPVPPTTSDNGRSDPIAPHVTTRRISVLSSRSSVFGAPILHPVYGDSAAQRELRDARNVDDRRHYHAGASRSLLHERRRQRLAQRNALLQAGDCQALASMLLEVSAWTDRSSVVRGVVLL